VRRGCSVLRKFRQAKTRIARGTECPIGSPLLRSRRPHCLCL
jgi:hypothetical protein